MLSRSVYFVYHEEHEGHEGLGNYHISIFNFVLFATSVVIMSGSILVAISPRWVLRDENFFTVKHSFFAYKGFFTDYKKLERVFAQRHRLVCSPAK